MAGCLFCTGAEGEGNRRRTKGARNFRRGACGATGGVKWFQPRIIGLPPEGRRRPWACGARRCVRRCWPDAARLFWAIFAPGQCRKQDLFKEPFSLVFPLRSGCRYGQEPAKQKECRGPFRPRLLTRRAAVPPRASLDPAYRRCCVRARFHSLILMCMNFAGAIPTMRAPSIPPSHVGGGKWRDRPWPHLQLWPRRLVSAGVSVPPVALMFQRRFGRAYGRWRTR